MAVGVLYTELRAVSILQTPSAELDNEPLFIPQKLIWQRGSHGSVREKYLTKCVPLHKAALHGDWEAAERLLIDDPTLAKAPITEGGETALHLASVEGHEIFVSNLLEKLEESETEIKNKKGSTALCFAAAVGRINIARLLVEKNKNLPTIRSSDGISPLYMAALVGHNQMADYLFPLSGFMFWNQEDQIALLTSAVESGLYGLAMNIVNQNNKLAVAEDSHGETPLQVLARKTLAFCGSCTELEGHWVPSYLRLKTHKMSDQCDAYTLLGCLWDHVISQEDVETAQVVGRNTSKLLFVAAESGNDEFLVELIRRYPDFLYKINEKKQSIFHVAVSKRYVQVFNLIHELSGVKDTLASHIDTDGNNMLHLAAKLAPENQLNFIPGAALQMQREVLWYKEVEKIVQPSYRNMKNKIGQTPYDLFLSEHKSLMKEGEKLMKQTAKACMLVTMLIATVVFTTAFTVPGGFNNYGAPILKNKKMFMVFPISEAVATLSSLSSTLMFLSILTSRYTENDFLGSLPFWLVTGVAALFVSIVAMVAAFCTCLLFYQHGLAVVTAMLVFFASVPLMFIFLKYPLFITILRCTCGCRQLFRSNNRLFS